MTALSIQPTFPIFTDIDGQPLEDGYVFIGTANLNPITNPITVYWDAALTLTAAQPIRTLGGYPMNSGTPARLYVNSDYSIQVQNKNGSLIYSAPAATERISSAGVTFIQAGTGAVTRTAQAKMRDVVSVKDFGAVGNGTADDTVAVTSAFNSGATAVCLPAGTYRITSKIAITASSLSVYGPGTLLVDVSEDYGFEGGSYAKIEFEDVTFDGNAKSRGAAFFYTSQIVRLNRCKIYNFITTTYTFGFVVADVEDVSITNCVFEKLRCPANGSIGDTNGAVRAIYGSGYLSNMLVDGCSFIDVNNYSGAVKQFEDADAVQLFVNPATSPEPQQNVRVSNCYFYDCGKRAVKLQGRASSNYWVEDNVCISTWTDASPAAAQGMYSFASHYGGNGYVSRNTMASGAVRYFMDSTGSEVRFCKYDANLFAPESHTTVGGNDTYGVLCGVADTGSRHHITNNTIKNIRYCLYYPHECYIANNYLESTNGLAFDASISVRGDNAVIIGNTITCPIATVGQAIFVGANAKHISIIGNAIKGAYDNGIYFATQVDPGFYCVVNGNIIQGVTTNAIQDFSNTTNRIASVGNSTDETSAGAPEYYRLTSAAWYVGSNVMGRLSSTGFNICIESRTAGQIASIGEFINTQDKFAGRMIRDSTNNRIMIASGSAAGSAWWVADGSASVTPV